MDELTEEQIYRAFYKLSLTEKISVVDNLVHAISYAAGEVERELAQKSARIGIARKLANNGKANKLTMDGIRNILSDDE